MYYSIKKGDRLGYSRVKSWFMDIRAIARMAHCSGAGGRQGADTLQISEQKYPYKAIKSMTVTCSEYDTVTGIANSSHCTGNSGNFKLSSTWTPTWLSSRQIFWPRPAKYPLLFIYSHVGGDYYLLAQLLVLSLPYFMRYRRSCVDGDRAKFRVLTLADCKNFETVPQCEKKDVRSWNRTSGSSEQH